MNIRELAPDLVGDSPGALPKSRSQEHRWTREIRRRLTAWTRDAAAPFLAAALHAVEADGAVRVEDSDLFVRYAPLIEGTGYVRPEVKLEFGARATGEPNAQMPIVCDAAPHVPAVEFPDGRTAGHAGRTDLLGEGYGRARLLSAGAIAWGALRAPLV